MKAEEIKPIVGKGANIGTLIYEGIKGKVAQQARIFQGDGTTYFVIDFDDNTQFQVALESSPIVRLSLVGIDGEGDLEDLAASEKIRVPHT